MEISPRASRDHSGQAKKLEAVARSVAVKLRGSTMPEEYVVYCTFPSPFNIKTHGVKEDRIDHSGRIRREA